MGPIPRAVLGVLVVVLMMPTTASARQLGAADAPETTGPLVFVSKNCSGRAKRVDGRLVARSRSCLRFYAMDPAFENDPDRNYGVVWMQSNVDAEPGFCATEVRSKITFPEAPRILERTPADRSVGRARGVLAKLTVEEVAVEPATIQKRFIMYPRAIRTAVKNMGRSFRLEWRGRSRAKLGFALGVEVSWHAAESPPESGSSLAFAYDRAGTC